MQRLGSPHPLLFLQSDTQPPEIKEREREREREREGLTMVGFSCLSTLYILPATSQQCLPLATFGRSNGRTSCHHKVEECKVTNRAQEDQLNRRDILRCFTTVVGLEMVAGSGLLTETATAADLIQRRQRSEFQASIKDTLFKKIKEHAELIPSILTLALNDAVTYDKATKSGGANGSIRLKQEISRLENAGLSAALDLVVEAKQEIDSYSKGGLISYADLIQLAAQSAVKKTFLASAIRKCGGNEEKGSLLYTAYGSSGQWGLFDKQFGRTDSPDPDPEGRIPLWDKASVQEMKNKFSAIGFGPRQLAVMSAFLGPDQLATENVLASDPEVRPWVEKYQRSRETVSQTDYEVDLITTLTKLSSLGQQINYEAYTYPVRRIELSKLKL